MAQLSYVPSQPEVGDQSGLVEATHDLLMADSAAERAAAARTLGTLGQPAATAYLMASLYDTSREVRQASAESLGLIGDASAIGPLSDLHERESNRQELDATISSAIFAITNRQANQQPSIAGQSAESKNEIGTVSLEAPPGAEESLASSEMAALLKKQAEQSKRIEQAKACRQAQEKAGAPVKVELPHQSEIEGPGEEEAQAESIGQHLGQIENLEAEIQAARAEVSRIASEEKERRSTLEAVAKAELEARRQAEHEQRRVSELEALRVEAEAELKRHVETEQQRPADLEAMRARAEAKARQRAEREKQLRAQIEMLRQVEARQVDRIQRWNYIFGVRRRPLNKLKTSSGLETAGSLKKRLTLQLASQLVRCLRRPASDSR